MQPRAGRPSFLSRDGPHVPFLRRLASAGRDPQAFRRRYRWLWVSIAVLGVTALALAPLADPRLGPLALRLENFLSLLFLAAAVGLWFGMGGRAYAVAGVVATLLYVLAAAFGRQFAIQDLESLAHLVGFLVFALAGFNLVFVLEEMVHDSDRILHPKGPVLQVSILLVVGAVAVGLPWWEWHGGPHLPVLWWSAIAGVWVLGCFAALRITGAIPDQAAVRRELYLFVTGVLAAGALVDLVAYLAHATGLLPSLVAYGALLGTWVYVTYTTLQRTHFLLHGDDPRPWMALLVGASFAVLAHAQSLFQVEGPLAIEELFHRRVLFLAAGVWAGLGLYVTRGMWIGLAWLRGSVSTKAAATVAGGASQVAAGLMAAEDKVERLAYQVYRGLDAIIPGTPHPPQRAAVGWQRELGIDPAATAISSDVTEVVEFTEVEVPTD